MLVADVAATVSALQVELAGVKSRMRERETEIVSRSDTIVNRTHENQLLERRIYGKKTERSQTSELQLALGDLFEAEKQLDQAVSKANEQTGAASRRRSGSQRPSHPARGCGIGWRVA
jgi:hypothetical protein